MIENTFPHTCTIISNNQEIKSFLESILDKINKGIGRIDTKSLSASQLDQLNKFIQKHRSAGEISIKNDSDTKMILNTNVSGQWTINPPNAKQDNSHYFSYSFCFRNKNHLDKFILYSTLGKEYTILEH